MRSPRSLHRTTARSSRSASAAASARPWLLSSVFAVCVSACVVLLAAPLLGLFLQPGEAEILQAGVTYLRIAGAFYVGIGGLFLLYGLYRAVGRPGMSLVLTVISLARAWRWPMRFRPSGHRRRGHLVVHPHRLGACGSHGRARLAARRAKVDRKFTPRRENALKSPVWCDMIGASFGKRETLWIWNTTKTKNWK